VPVGRVQAALRGAFARWGLPGRVKVDNGSPWGSKGDLPTPLALWLFGLGVAVAHNPPRRPQCNGVVERSHGTAQRWADPSRCHSAEELQARLDRDDEVQRREYLGRDGLTRWQRWPGLAHSGRRYDQAGEALAWRWRAALEAAAGRVASRRVDCCGKIGLYGGKLGVGARLAGREVAVELDAEALEWVVADPAGPELCRRPLTQFSPEGLLALPDEPPCPEDRFKARGQA
jgi:hypothetical protein